MNTPSSRAAELVDRHDNVFLVLLDRNDSASWKKETQRNAEYIRSLTTHKELLLDLNPNPTDRLRIWRLGR